MKFIFCGYGGQGIMLMGTVLAHAAFREGKFVSQSPSYGAEMRGGASNNYVIVEEKPVLSPVVELADLVAAMEPGALARFASRVRPGGALLLNSDLVAQDPGRADVVLHRLPVSALAERAGDRRTLNMVALGAVAALTGVVRPATIKALLPEFLGAGRPGLLAANERALELGLAALAAAGGARAGGAAPGS